MAITLSFLGSIWQWVTACILQSDQYLKLWWNRYINIVDRQLKKYKNFIPFFFGFSNSDDNLLKNIELFDKLSLRFNGRVLFIKDVIGDEICCWSFYGQGRKLAEVCCTSIVYATEKKQTKVLVWDTTALLIFPIYNYFTLFIVRAFFFFLLCVCIFLLMACVPVPLPCIDQEKDICCFLQVEFPEARIYEETLNVLLYETPRVPDNSLLEATSRSRSQASHSEDDDGFELRDRVRRIHVKRYSTYDDRQLGH